MTQKITWAVGVTTITSRVKTLLPQTLESLRKAGFPKPWLFIDCEEGYSLFNTHKIEGSTSRHPRFGSANLSNWTLGIWELYLRNPHADCYAMFEDDALACWNLREYLDRGIPFKSGMGYLNLLSFPSNLVGRTETGWHPAIERGKGALGLVFDKKGITKLLTSRSFVDGTRVISRAEKAIDAIINRAAGGAGMVEYVHNPSLLFHTGIAQSTISKGHNGLPQAQNFPGEAFNALNF